MLLAIGQNNAFPWIEKDLGIEFNERGLAKVNSDTFQSTFPQVFLGRCGTRSENIITAVAQGHQAAISIDQFLQNKPVEDRPAPFTNLMSQKMGIHDWSYSSAVSDEERQKVPHAPLEEALKSRKLEVELGFDDQIGL